ncbi:hypothetical protein KM043_015037 [Ampulex compressa]|nr:hypothetical protein KM043_015037 [Ampulex compressa]
MFIGHQNANSILLFFRLNVKKLEKRIFAQNDSDLSNQIKCGAIKYQRIQANTWITFRRNLRPTNRLCKKGSCSANIRHRAAPDFLNTRGKEREKGGKTMIPSPKHRAKDTNGRGRNKIFAVGAFVRQDNSRRGARTLV